MRVDFIVVGLQPTKLEQKKKSWVLNSTCVLFTTLTHLDFVPRYRSPLIPYKQLTRQIIFVVASFIDDVYASVNCICAKIDRVGCETRCERGESCSVKLQVK